MSAAELICASCGDYPPADAAVCPFCGNDPDDDMRPCTDCQDASGPTGEARFATDRSGQDDYLVECPTCRGTREVPAPYYRERAARVGLVKIFRSAPGVAA